ncbi:hypothetical protein BKI52_08770 [marine bacterium AO1-C]|nr:hypothetical protein BKI52_08770 [marine bacterium AO1-C]
MKVALLIFLRLCLIQFLLICGVVQAQDHKVDSLQSLLKSAKGKTRVDILNELSDFYSRKQSSEPIAFAREALSLAKKIDYQLGQAFASYNLGHHLSYQGNNSQAMDYLFSALKIYEPTNLYKKKAFVYRSIGHIYGDWGDYESAILYYQKQLNIGKKNKDKNVIGSAYINLSYTFLRNNKPNKALDFIEKATEYSTISGDTLGQTVARSNRAVAYFQLGQYQRALQLHLMVFHWYKDHNYQDYEQFACADLAKDYLKLNKKDSALYYAQLGYRLAMKLQSKPKMNEISEILYTIHKKYGETKKALSYLEIAKTYLDSIAADKKKSARTNQSATYLLEKYKKENQSLKNYKSNNERSRATQNIILIAGALVLVFLLVIGFLLYRNNQFNKERSKIISKNRVDIILQNKELKRQHQDIEQKNDQLRAQHLHIYNSIRAAQTIQQAILPQDNFMRDLLFDYFIIFRPRHIVSGDFYWISSIGTQFQNESQEAQGLKTLLAVVDSTGHGVPGAFMSMIGNTLLDRIVKIERVTTPSEILNQLNHEIYLALKQNHTNNDEGMELSICSVEKCADSKVRVVFSGARRPLYVVRNGLSASRKKIEVFRSSKRYVGGKRNVSAVFTDEEVVLEYGDALYMCTDGFADQNNDDRKKFGSERLVNLLLENAHWPMAKQKQLLTIALEEHQGENEQRDDILLLGYRIT